MGACLPFRFPTTRRSFAVCFALVAAALYGCNLEDPLESRDASGTETGPRDVEPVDSDDSEGGDDTSVRDGGAEVDGGRDLDGGPDVDGGCQPSDEECNGEDDDCDGTTDEGCSCPFDGKSKGVCQMGEVDDEGNCIGPKSFQTDETNCDQKDNDCDGTTDENCPCDFDGTSKGVCANGTVDPSDGSCTEPGDYEKTETSCDSKDNDCDGATDDDDSDLSCQCAPSGKATSCYTGPAGTKSVGACAPGQKTCKNDGTWSDCSGDTVPKTEGGGSNCNNKDSDCDGTTDEGCPCDYKMKSDGVCSGQTRTSSGTCSQPAAYEATESDCSDALDNDCDGDTDCADSDCSSRACGTGTGATCQNNNCRETNCGDALDNDQDGTPDCGDSDCTGATCNGSGTTCVSGDNGCHESNCTDGNDNDSDGKVDVCDADCTGSCGTGASCSSVTAGVCSETNCENSSDDDGDGSSDCADSDCDGAVCAGSGTSCLSTDNTCHETACTDGVDNDGDGSIDCADTDCPCPSGETCCTGLGRTPSCQSTC